MATRKDQLQSHQFLTQRVIAAVVTRETDPAQSPLRRGIGAVFAGLMIAVMIGAGFGVYGLLTKTGSSNWKTDGAVIIEKETGASFVYQGGTLHPMVNYASALLATAGEPRAVYEEPANALAGVPRGVMLGIPYAPDSLPDAAHTIRAPWTVCTAAVVDGSGTQTASTTLALGTAPDGGTPLGERGLLVRDPATTSAYLVWHGTRYSVSTALIPALFGAVTPWPAGTAWLNGLPRGADIAPFALDGNGDPSPAAGKYEIGQVLSTPVGSGGVQFWLVLSDGLAPITEMQKDIAVSQGAPGPTTVTAVDISAIHRTVVPSSGTTAALPPRPPTLAQLPAPSSPMCAVFADATTAPTVSFAARLPAGVTGTPTGSRTSDGTVLADRVLVPPGHVAVVSVMASSTSDAGGYYLVTDLGIRYAVASADVLKALGYDSTDAVAIPAGLVRLIPAGPALDPAAAGTPAAGGG